MHERMAQLDAAGAPVHPAPGTATTPSASAWHAGAAPPCTRPTACLRSPTTPATWCATTPTRSPTSRRRRRAKCRPELASFSAARWKGWPAGGAQRLVAVDADHLAALAPPQPAGFAGGARGVDGAGALGASPVQPQRPSGAAAKAVRLGRLVEVAVDLGRRAHQLRPGQAAWAAASGRWPMVGESGRHRGPHRRSRCCGARRRVVLQPQSDARPAASAASRPPARGRAASSAKAAARDRRERWRGGGGLRPAERAGDGVGHLVGVDGPMPAARHAGEAVDVAEGALGFDGALEHDAPAREQAREPRLVQAQFAPDPAPHLVGVEPCSVSPRKTRRTCCCIDRPPSPFAGAIIARTWRPSPSTRLAGVA